MPEEEMPLLIQPGNLCNSIFEKLMPILDNYMFTQLKLQQLKRNYSITTDQEIKLQSVIGKATEDIQQIIDNQ